MSSFELRSGESVPHAVRRVARHEIDALRAELRRGPRPEAVHEARKSSKKLRALVRLVRDELGEKRYRRENRTLRDAMRPLGPLRDADVLVNSVDLLAKRFRDEVRPGAFDTLRRSLRARAREARRAPGIVSAVRHASAVVGRVRRRLRRWALRRGGWGALQPGLARIYANARAAKRRVDGDPSDECLHELRKRAKDVRYANEFLEPLWPPVLTPFADQLHALTDHLGDDHDLAELARTLRSAPESCGSSQDCTAFLGLIDVRRRELQAEARRLGERLFDEKRRCFVARLHGYWIARNGTRPQS